MEEYTGVKFIPLREGSWVDLKIASIDKYISKLLYIIQNISKTSIPDGAGNVSMRLPVNPEMFLISATGLDLTKISSKNDFSVVVKVDQPKIHYFGNLVPSSESPMHGLIYQEFSSINYIIHTHPQHIRKIQECRNIGITNKIYPYGTFQAGQEVISMLKNTAKILLRDHGVVVVGEDENKVLSQLNYVENSY